MKIRRNIFKKIMVVLVMVPLKNSLLFLFYPNLMKESSDFVFSLETIIIFSENDKGIV